MKNFLYAIFYEMIKIINWLISIRHLYLRKSRYLVQVRYRLYQVFRYQVQVKVKNEIHFINLIMVPFYRSHWIKSEYIYCFLWLFKTFSQKWPKARCEFFYYVVIDLFNKNDEPLFLPKVSHSSSTTTMTLWPK
jgi:hypothetical protein